MQITAIIFKTIALGFYCHQMIRFVKTNDVRYGIWAIIFMICV